MRLFANSEAQCASSAGGQHHRRLAQCLKSSTQLLFTRILVRRDFQRTDGTERSNWRSIQSVSKCAFSECDFQTVAFHSEGVFSVDSSTTIIAFNSTASPFTTRTTERRPHPTCERNQFCGSSPCRRAPRSRHRQAEHSHLVFCAFLRGILANGLPMSGDEIETVVKHFWVSSVTAYSQLQSIHSATRNE